MLLYEFNVFDLEVQRHSHSFDIEHLNRTHEHNIFDSVTRSVFEIEILL